MSGGHLRLKFADLGVRILSAAVLISIALLDFWHGGVWVALLVTLGAGLMLWEFRRILAGTTPPRDPVLWIMTVGGGLSVLVTGFASLAAGLAVLAASLAALAVAAGEKRLWMLGGLLYITLAMDMLVEMRRDPVLGFPLVLWLVCVVIAADVGGYFAGRLIGGPKLWVTVSPNKTWAGALGGLGLALLVGVAFHGSGHVALPWLVALSGALAVASQLGDLLESSVKRRFGVKDSSHLIPGHGGLLDRFDGLLGALWAYGLLLLSGALAV